MTVIEEAANSKATVGPLMAAFAAAFLPAVIFLLFAHEVVRANVDRLLYDPYLVGGFAAAFLVSTAALAVSSIRALRRGSTTLLRGCIAVAAFLLVSEQLRPYLDAPGISRLAQAAADLAVAGIAAALVCFAGSPMIFVATIYAAGLIGWTAYDHWAFAATVPDYKFAQNYATNAPYVPEPSGKPQGNVYHLILDAFPGEYFPVSADLGKFDGFTFYRYFNSNYPRTAASVPGMLHSHYLDDGDSYRQIYEQAPRKGLFTDLAAEGVRLSLYPFLPGWCIKEAGRCYSLNENMLRDGYGAIFRLTTLDLWFLKLLPNAVRGALNPDGVTTGSAFQGDEASQGFSVSHAILRALAPDEERALARLGSLGIDYQEHGLKQFDLMLEDEAERPAKGQYIFWHGMFPHGPRVTNGECQFTDWSGNVPLRTATRCAAKLAERLIARLKELGKYDDALIIIQSDHGQLPETDDPDEWAFATKDTLAKVKPETITPEYEDRLSNDDETIYTSYVIDLYSSGLLLVKPPKAKGPLAVSDAPAQNVDIAPTIAKHFDFSRQEYAGTALDALSSVKGRPNVFIGVTRLDPNSRGKAARYELVDGTWKLIRPLDLAY